MAEFREINEDRLYSDNDYRFNYLVQFLNVTPKDIELIHGSAKVLGPLVDTLVDGIYEHLFNFSATKDVFCDGYTEKEIERRIKTLKSSLSKFLVKLVTEPYDSAMVATMDRIGKGHTTAGGRIHVRLVHMNVLLGFVQDAIIGELFKYKYSKSEGADAFDVEGTVRAFGKAITILNDFITKWYEPETAEKKKK